jgi:Carbohydrate family 9 binding domain-like
MKDFLQSVIFIHVIAVFAWIPAQNMSLASKSEIKIKFIENELSPETSLSILNADPTDVKKYWSGNVAPVGRHFKVRLLWSRTALYVLFEANQREPLVVSDKPDLDKKTLGLWNRDVCEIFLAPDKSESRKYFEFEVAPTGEWVDVALDLTSGERKSDWDYKSEMTVISVGSRKNSVAMLIKIPWQALGAVPKAGDVWLGNILRCVGKDPDRGYLAWSPTMTKNPNFHVPEKFGKFIFQK